jgi:hypothetical protein
MFHPNKAEVSMNTTKLNFWIDVIIGVAFMLALLSGRTAQSIHGKMAFHLFISLGLSIGIVIHLILHRKWMAAAGRSSEKSGQLKLNLWLNRLLAVTWLWTLLSGLHGHLDPINGAPTHALAAASMTGILLVHLARHWKWVVTATKRYWG